MSNKCSRRDFLKGSALAVAGTMVVGGLASCGSSSKEEWDNEADVVVVGYGGAGACAAIAAADAGASVVIVEKNPEDAHFTNTAMSGGGFHCPDPNGDKEALKQYLRAMISGDNVDGRIEGDENPLFVDEIVEKYAEYEPGVIDFLQSIDPDFEAFGPMGGAAFGDFPGAEDSGYAFYVASYNGKATGPTFPSLDTPKEDTAGGLAMFNCLKTGVEARSGSISVLWETPAESLVVDEDGAVIGIVAKQGESPMRIKASKGVVLASGGFEFNPAMRKSFLEGPGVNGWAFYGSPSNTGDGILMASAIGAQLAKMSKCEARLIWACPDAEANGCLIGSVTDSVGTEGAIIVNARGERFMDETLVTQDPSRYLSYKEAAKMDIQDLTYPNIPAYLIIDEAKRQEGSLVGLTWSTVAFGLIPWQEGDDENKTLIDNGWMYQADTFEELARKIKEGHDINMGRMDPDTFVAQMEHYEKIVESGVDDQFGRSPKYMDPLTHTYQPAPFQPIATPPFYALPLVAGGPITAGGLQTDANCRVVDWNDEPIARLYAAGEMACTFKFMYQGGGNLTDNIVRGRIAGECAAAESTWDSQ